MKPLVCIDLEKEPRRKRELNSGLLLSRRVALPLGQRGGQPWGNGEGFGHLSCIWTARMTDILRKVPLGVEHEGRREMCLRLYFRPKREIVRTSSTSPPPSAPPSQLKSSNLNKNKGDGGEGGGVRVQISILNATHCGIPHRQKCTPGEHLQQASVAVGLGEDDGQRCLDHTPAVKHGVLSGLAARHSSIRPKSSTPRDTLNVSSTGGHLLGYRPSLTD